MVIPFMFIYLHNVRGIELGVAGLIVAAHAVVSIVSGPVFGSQIDRFGGKRMLALSLVILAVGYASYAFVHVPWQGFLVAIVSGIGVGGFWPSQSTLITGLTPADQRPSAFAMQRVVMNLGIGLGALTGGLIATTDSPGSFTALFLLDAATFLAYACVMVVLVPEPDLHASGHGGRTGSYRDVLRHRPFVAVIALNALFIFAGFSGFDVLPVYAKNESGLSETQIGLLFLVNTLVIVFTQLPIARLARGRRRMPTLALFGLLWAGAWLLVPIAGAVQPETAFAVLVVVMVVFAIGQCLHGAVAGAPRGGSRRATPHGPVHGPQRTLVADRVRARPCPRRSGARGVAQRCLDRGRLTVRDRSCVHAGRGGRASDSSASHTDTGSSLGLSRQAPGLQSRTWR